MQILLGSILVLVTTFVHGACTIGVLDVLRAIRNKQISMRSRWSHVLVICLVVLMLFLASVLEASIWAGVYLAVDAVSSFEAAFYFSVVTFTTLGYGDILLSEQWRVLASFQAVTGIIVFGWTTALVVALLQYFLKHEN